MNEVLNKIKELTAQCEALNDPKTIEIIIRTQVQHIKEQFNDILKEKENFAKALSRVEEQMIKEYCTKKGN